MSLPASLQTTAQRYPAARPYNTITERQQARAVQNRLNEPRTCRCGKTAIYRDGTVGWCRRCGAPPT